MFRFEIVRGIFCPSRSIFWLFYFAEFTASIFENEQLFHSLFLCLNTGKEVIFQPSGKTHGNGQLSEASTRGDGEVGEEITHNIPAFENVPLAITYKKRLVITGEAFIRQKDFMRLNAALRDRNEETYKNTRNLAAGSVRSLDPANCKGRCVTFLPFNVLEGLSEGENSNSREERLYRLSKLGFGSCPYIPLNPAQISPEYLEQCIQNLKERAEELDLPIDGIVLIFDDLAYSASCGRTGHHYKDGLAFKFEDETYETVLRDIEWTPSRLGELAPVAVFDTVEIDGCSVSRASLHNLTFIKDLELTPGCRILVSKRNMIIPHIEGNLDRGALHGCGSGCLPVLQRSHKSLLESI